MTLESKARATFKTAVELAQKHGNRRLEVQATVSLAKTFSEADAPLVILGSFYIIVTC